MANVYTSADQIDFTLKELPAMPVPQKVMMVKPTYFDVTYVINPHMSGHVGMVDTIQAGNEWNSLLDGFKELGFEMVVLDGQEGLPDMVFCANQSLPFCDERGDKKVIMGIMYTPERKEEVPFIEQWFRQNGYEVYHLDEKKVNAFEGMGDGIWHFKRQLLWGGYGIRTSFDAYEQISNILDVPVIALELKDERFYHLDTCFCSLDEKSVLIYPNAFSTEGLSMIHALYENVIEAGIDEAEKLLAVNAVAPDGKNVLIQRGCTDVNNKLLDHGFNVHEFSTDEFLKSGGSVFCMKLLLW